MARKKNVPIEPEYSAPGMEETPQYPEGEAPVEDGQTATAEAASEFASEQTPEDGAAPVEDAPSDEPEAPAAQEGEPPLEVDGGAAGESVGGDDPPQEESAADPQYAELLHEMDGSSPVPLLEGYIPEDVGQEQANEAPPLVEDGGAPLSSDGTEEPPAPDPRFMEVPAESEVPAERASRPRSRRAPTQRSDYVLTIDARDRVQTEEDREAVIWHEVRNAYRTRRILTGILGGVEQTKSGRTLAIVDYKGFRVAIPIMEMMLYTGEMPSNREYLELMSRLNRTLSTMLGAEIDFVVKGIDSNTRSIVASRKDAMLRKRKTFYLDTDELGEHMIYEGRVVQARVIAVAEKIIRVEAFGVECPIVARDLSWEWLGDARDFFSVGSRILIRVLTIDRSSLEEMSITADVRSVSSTTNLDNVKKCQPQCRYAGRVTDVRGGVVYIRLNNGVNAIAHACYDLRTPGKKDDVSFAVTRLDEEKGIALGIITRIIKQNL